MTDAAVASLTFDELRELICQVGRIADKLAKGEEPTEQEKAADRQQPGQPQA